MNTGKINLFCIPFAGGSCYSYKDFNKQPYDFINYFPLELPGRGKRFSEKLLPHADDLVEDIFNVAYPLLQEPYAIYGHSMGALLGFLLTKKILNLRDQQHRILPPLHLFVSGAPAPSVKRKRTQLHLLPRNDFIKLLREYDGTPSEVLSDDEMFDFFEPILRSDFQAVETYMYEVGTPFNVPISVMIGLNDSEAAYEDAIKWQRETNKKISIHTYCGGHFFIFKHIAEIIHFISQTLKKVMLSKSPDMAESYAKCHGF